MSPEDRFRALVAAFAEHPGVTGPAEPGRRGFGAAALKVNGAIFALLSHDRLVVKLAARRVEALIAAGTGGPYDAGKGRPLKEWLAVSAAAEDEQWSALAGEALDFVAGKRGVIPS